MESVAAIRSQLQATQIQQIITKTPASVIEKYGRPAQAAVHITNEWLRRRTGERLRR